MILFKRFGQPAHAAGHSHEPLDYSMVGRVIGPVHGQIYCRQQVTPQAYCRKENKPIIRASAILISANKNQSTEKMSVAAC